MPLSFVRFPLSDPLPLLKAALFLEAAKEVRPDWVPTNVLREKIPDVLYGPRQRHVERHLCCAGVVGLERAEKGGVGATAVGIEKLRGNLKSAER